MYLEGLITQTIRVSKSKHFQKLHRFTRFPKIALKIFQWTRPKNSQVVTSRFVNTSETSDVISYICTTFNDWSTKTHILRFIGIQYAVMRPTGICEQIALIHKIVKNTPKTGSSFYCMQNIISFCYCIFISIIF